MEGPSSSVSTPDLIDQIAEFDRRDAWAEWAVDRA